MFIFLSKFLPLFVYPAGLVFVLLIGALLFRQQQQVLTVMLLLALVVLWVGSSRWVAMPLIRELEHRHLPPETYPQVETAVVLGGATWDGGAPRPHVEVNEGGDRLIHATWLWKNGYAERILVSGGEIAWRTPDGTQPEAERMAFLLELMGVSAEAILLEARSQNTVENATFSAEMLPPDTAGPILLVTSARHMPRSVRLYEQQGYTVIPAPTDFLVSDIEWQFVREAPFPEQLIGLMPSSYYLSLTTEALREYIGLLIYDLRGWI